MNTLPNLRKTEPGHFMKSFQPANSSLFTPGHNSTLSFYRPSNPDTILNAMTEEEYAKDQFLPYWAENWPATDALFDYCLQKGTSLQSPVCEIGCGLGVLSALLATQGHDPVATDIAMQGCSFARVNISRYSQRATVVCADWRYSPFRRIKFNTIIGADILYEKRWIEPVLVFIAQHLSQKGIALIADPKRQHWEGFKSRAVEYGFILSTLKVAQVNNAKTTVEIVALQQESG